MIYDSSVNTITGYGQTVGAQPPVQVMECFISLQSAE
jgi:hypothetical protein